MGYGGPLLSLSFLYSQKLPMSYWVISAIAFNFAALVNVRVSAMKIRYLERISTIVDILENHKGHIEALEANSAAHQNAP